MIWRLLIAIVMLGCSREDPKPNPIEQCKKACEPHTMISYSEKHGCLCGLIKDN